MARDNQLTIYVEDDIKQELERNANEEDQTVSTYAANLLERQLQTDATDQIEREQNAEERINELIALGKDELTQMGTEIADLQQDIRELHAKTGVYAVANWEVLKQSVDDDERRAALSTGSQRLRDDRDPVDAEPANETAETTATDERQGPFERMNEADDAQDDDRRSLDERLGEEDSEADDDDDDGSIFDELREDQDRSHLNGGNSD
jgi:sugar-specific transcriptional regulator TrmB